MYHPTDCSTEQGSEQFREFKQGSIDEQNEGWPHTVMAVFERTILGQSCRHIIKISQN